MTEASCTVRFPSSPSRCGVPDRGVIHPQVVADAADDDGPGIEPDPHADRGSARGFELPAVVPQRALDPERGVHRPPRRVLVGDRRTEERHHAVAG
jgi:hypothetical protein